MNRPSVADEGKTTDRRLAMWKDSALQDDVIEELRDEPGVDASQIGVIANNGVVTLTGTVASYAQKRAAEEAAKRVYGVKGVADDIEVRLPYGSERNDPELARAALDVMKWDSRVPDDCVTVTVDKGWVTLAGT